MAVWTSRFCVDRIAAGEIDFFSGLVEEHHVAARARINAIGISLRRLVRPKRNAVRMVDHIDVRRITVGHIHAERGDPMKVAAMHAWLLANPEADLPPLNVRAKDNGTYRIHDGRHRFVAHVLAERPLVPIEVGTT